MNEFEYAKNKFIHPHTHQPTKHLYVVYHICEHFHTLMNNMPFSHLHNEHIFFVLGGNRNGTLLHVVIINPSIRNNLHFHLSSATSSNITAVATMNGRE